MVIGFFVFLLLEWSAVFFPRQFLKYVMTGIESYAAHCSSNVCFVYDENVNKIDFIALYCIVGPVLEQVKMPAEERRAKNFKSHRKIVL